MVGIGLQSSAKVNEPKKRRRLARNKRKDSDRRSPIKGHVAANGTLPEPPGHIPELGESSARAVANHESGDSQRINLGPIPGSEPLSGSSQAYQGQGAPNLDPRAFEKMERQALRRRKVEALESLAHTAALFLAEFMDFKKGRQEPQATTSSPPPPGPRQHQSDPGAGEVYAAAAAAGVAASLFRPLSEEMERSGYNSSGSEMEQPSSSYDSSDDEDVLGKAPSEPKDDMDMDDRESHGTPSNLLAPLRNGEEADVSEPGVKV